MGFSVARPVHAIVLSVEEKSQIQALDRTQPHLPDKKGGGAMMGQDYKRHGATTLLTTMIVLISEVFGRKTQRRQHQELVGFRNALER